jgi:hypothetical protein
VRNTTATIATIIVGDRIAATKRLFSAGDRTQPKERGGEKEGIREWHLFDPFRSPAESAKGSDRTALRPFLPSFSSLGNKVQVISFFPSFALLALPTKARILLCLDSLVGARDLRPL